MVIKIDQWTVKCFNNVCSEKNTGRKRYVLFIYMGELRNLSS